MKPKVKIIPDYARLPLLVLLIYQLMVYSGTQLLAGLLPHSNWETRWDLMIPFLPWTVVIYIGSFLFWIVGCVLSVRYDRDRAYRFLSADLLAKTLCLACFLLVPTTNTRPALEGSGFWIQCMRLIYKLDAPSNLFPSIHCLLSWLCYLGVRGEKRIPKAYRVFSCLFAGLVFVSTLTTKQHILIDVLGGWFIASVCYWFSGHSALPKLYQKIFEKNQAVL